jgi:hypothetical protein
MLDCRGVSDSGSPLVVGGDAGMTLSGHPRRLLAVSLGSPHYPGGPLPLGRARLKLVF